MVRLTPASVFKESALIRDCGNLIQISSSETHQKPLLQGKCCGSQPSLGFAMAGQWLSKATDSKAKCGVRHVGDRELQERGYLAADAPTDSYIHWLKHERKQTVFGAWGAGYPIVFQNPCSIRSPPSVTILSPC